MKTRRVNVVLPEHMYNQLLYSKKKKLYYTVPTEIREIICKYFEANPIDEDIFREFLVCENLTEELI